MSNNKEIWGERIMNDGYAKIPHILRKNRTKLGLSSTEYIVLIDYIAEWHYTETTNPYPKLMEYSGFSQRSLQYIIKSMENKGLLKREIISKTGVGKTGVKFNLSPLLNKLRSLGETSCTTPGEETSCTTPGEETSCTTPGEETSCTTPGEESCTTTPSVEESCTTTPSVEESCTTPGEETSCTTPGEESCTTSTKNTKNKEKEKESTTKEKEKESRLQKDFKKFWDTYPRKKSKGDAEKAWKQIKPSSELVEIIISKVVLLKSSQQWLQEGAQFIPYPATWLRAKGWEDEVGPRSFAPSVASFEPDDTENDTELAREEFYTLNYQRAKDEVLKDYEDEEGF